MSKYEPLKEFLMSEKQSEIKLSFLEIERIMKSHLPNSAYTYNAWWTNGGQSQAESWMSAGYITKSVDIPNRTVVFCRQNTSKIQKQNFLNQNNKSSISDTEKIPVQPPHKTPNTSLTVCGYEFHFVQQLIPQCENGRVKEYTPQKEYSKCNGLPLGPNGSGTFCRFSIRAHPIPGVYLWVVGNKIIYIGETSNLQRRFNNGYGIISPRNCYVGGQSTNCKMNKVVMEYYKNGTPISLYFYQTTDYKQVELNLLKQIRTKYNVKDN